MSLLAFYGVVFVISLSGVMSPGPLTAFIISLGRRNPWAGAWITLGHALIEVPLILALFAGLQPFFESPGIRESVSLLGGGALVYMGGSVLRSAGGKEVGSAGAHRRNAVAGGILLTALNPYWVVWWLTVGASIITRTGTFGLVAGLVGMVVVHLLADAAWAVFLTWSAHRGSRVIGEAGWRRIELGCGWVMLAFGVFFVYDGLASLTA